MKTIYSTFFLLISFPVICYVINNKKLSKKMVIQEKHNPVFQKKENLLFRGNEAPSVYISFESNQIIAHAFDLDGQVQIVEFFQNGELIGVDSIYPYQLDFSIIKNKKGSFSAKVIDDLGTYSLSIAVNN